MNFNLLKTLSFILFLFGCKTYSYASDFELDGGYYTITSMNDLEVRLDSVKYNIEDFSLVNNISYKDRNLNLISISENSFSKAIGLKSLKINTTAELPSSLLSSCINLESLIIESNIDVIPQNFCKGCVNLSSLTLPTSIKSLEEGCFEDCEKLSYFSNISSNINYIGKSALKNNNINLEKFFIEESSEILKLDDWISNEIYPSNIFLGRKLQSTNEKGINMGKNVLNISYSNYVDSLPNSFFADNREITTINLPVELTKIPADCFYNCSNLNKISLPNGVTTIEDQAFYNTSLLTLCSSPNLTTINYRAFYNTKIETLKFDCPIEYIGDEAFNNAKNVSLPATLKTVEADAFGDLNTLIIEQGKDTLWLGTKLLKTSTLVNSALNDTYEEAESHPGVKTIYLKTLTSHNIENQILGNRPIEIRKILYYSGKELKDWERGYYYCIYNNYIYFPSILNPGSSKIYIDNNINNLRGNTEAYNEEIKSILTTSNGRNIVYLDNNEIIPNGILNPNQCEKLSVISINNNNPPEIADDFPNSVYINATLRVPIGSKQNYEIAEYWKGFWNIEEVDFSKENIWELPATIQEINLNVSEATLNINENLQLEIYTVPENASYQSLTWSSSNEEVATVNEGGLVFALSEGKATITANCDGITASCEITVLKPVIDAETIILNISEAELYINETIQLETMVIPEETTDKSVTWNSSNESVAFVSEDGLVTAISTGEVIITATCGEVSAECKITVLEDAGVESLLSNPDSKISIYTPDGILIKKDYKVKDINTLSKGLYIIKAENRSYKIAL